jgi:AcrR family transcriptional regulator
MPGTTRRTARKPAEDRRREIADAALRVIAAQGLGRFTALAIAREVGLTDGALFRHFRSKEEIVDAAIDRVEELLFDGVPPSSEDPIERLGHFFLRRVAVIGEHAGISRLLVSEELARAASETGVKRVEGFRRRSAAFVRACLSEAETLRMLPAGLGAAEASVVVMGSILALAHWPVAAQREPAVALAPRIWKALESLLRGKRGGSPAARPRAPRRSGRRSNTGGRS